MAYSNTFSMRRSETSHMSATAMAIATAPSGETNVNALIAQLQDIIGDGGRQKIEHVKKYRPQFQERFRRGTVQHLEFQNHDSDDDGNDAVAEGFQS